MITSYNGQKLPGFGFVLLGPDMWRHVFVGVLGAQSPVSRQPELVPLPRDCRLSCFHIVANICDRFLFNYNFSFGFAEHEYEITKIYSCAFGPCLTLALASMYVFFQLFSNCHPNSSLNKGPVHIFISLVAP